MITFDNKNKSKCSNCKQDNIIYNMFIFNNLLYCFKCSMNKLKNMRRNQNEYY